LKFGDIITAVASLAVGFILLDWVLLELFVPMSPKGGTAHALTAVGSFLSVLVVSLIVGYLFAFKIHEESRMGAIGSIAVLFTVLLMIVLVAMLASPFVYPAVTDNINSMFSTATTSTWTNFDWFVAAVGVVATNVILALVSSFIGLYLGSMRKPSAKTKE
jgi:hypothetical protein